MVVFMLSAVGGTVFVEIVKAGTRRQCLAAGYPQASQDWTLKGYCIKRVDQTDVVVALSELRKP